ncbi:MAG: glycosyltransferase family 4 protein [Acidobacteria bacterium]|nr:glycosyltransferase family 4 protein [Acidobacteriota bacterium]
MVMDVSGGLRIAFLSPDFHPQVGGAHTYSRFLLGELAARGNAVEILAATARGIPSAYRVDGLPVRRLGSADDFAGRARRIASFARAAERALDRTRPDVVLAQYSALLPASRFARRSGTPLVALVHDLYGLGANLRLRGLSAGALRFLANDRLLAWSRPDAVLVDSESTAVEVRRVLRAPIAVARPGADHVPDGPEPDPLSRQALFVGRLVGSKGVADAVRAVGLARRRIPDATLLVVGAGPDEARLPPWARAPGELADQDLDRVFRESALLVLPSRREGWGLALSEAAARGIPYIAYSVPAVREQDSLIRGGLVVPVGNVAALTDGIEALLADSALRRRLGARGQDRARRLLTWAGTAAVAETALLRAIEQRGRARNRAGSRTSPARRIA